MRSERLVQEGHWREDGGPVLAARGQRARAAHGRAHGAQLPRAPVGGRDDGRRVRRARCRAPGARCSTRARRPRACARSRRRRWRRAARATTARGLYDAILIKENHIAAAGGIAAGGRRGARGARLSWRTRSRSRCATPRRSTRRSPRARRACCSTTWTTQQLRAAVAQVRGPRAPRGERRRDARDAPGARAHRDRLRSRWVR